MQMGQERKVNQPDEKVHVPIRGVHPQQTNKASGLEAGGGTRFPNFKSQGGPVINAPQLSILFVGDWTSTENQTRAARLRQFTSDFLNSQYMNILSQYGCGSKGKLITSVFVNSPNQSLSAADIQNILQTAIDTGRIPEPAAVSPDGKLSSGYLLFLDNGIAVDDNANPNDPIRVCEPDHDNGFGFHDSFVTRNGNTCPFAIVPGLTDSCLRNACEDDSRCSLHLDLTQEQRQTQVASHELSEMFSDPVPRNSPAFTDIDDRGPDGNPVGENGDLCNGRSATITVGPNTWTVQEMYSKVDDERTNGARYCIVGAPDPL